MFSLIIRYLPVQGMISGAYFTYYDD